MSTATGLRWLGALASLLLAAQGPPRTQTDNVKEVLHGVEITDPYRWLEDQKSPQTRAWIEAQNRYTRSILDPLPGRAALAKRLTELMKIDLAGMPQVRNGRYFFSKRLANQEQFVIYVRKGLKGRDEVLIDPHPLSPDRTVSVNLRAVSNDGKRVAYAVRQGGEDEVVLKLLDVDTRQELPDRLPRARYFSVSFKHDGSGFYYSRHGAQGSRIYYHALGTDPAKDAQIFGQGYGPEWAVDAGVSDDGRYLIIHASKGSAADVTEVYVQDLAGGGPIVPVVKDLAARTYGEAAGDRLIVQTNWQAPNGRILAIDLKNPARERWREVVPASSAVIEGFSLAGGKLFVNYLENVRSSARMFEPDGRRVRDITFPALGTVSGMAGRWDSQEAFYAFTSFHIPGTIYRYDVASGRQEVWSEPKVPFESKQFEVQQVWYSSKDRSKVPMFLLHRRGLERDGSHPALLTGYGGFGSSSTPGFSAVGALWAERGGVFAVANLRGGGEFGEEWHKAGMLANKQNVFDDFIAGAEWLIANRYTQPPRLAIRGGSNGGLLVGAALTQRPDLFGAVLCTYPLLDMVRYHKFLLAKLWVSEYGSSENPEQFKYLYAYSPYHRVKPGMKYPAAMFVTGDSDTRVDPLHARKMAARLQAATGSGRPVLLLYDTKSGHSGGRPVSKQIEETTDELSFLFAQAEAARPQGPPAARTGNVKEALHGVAIVDPYRWLEDQNSPETRAWIEAQHQYTRSVLDPLVDRQRLKQRLTELMKVEQTGMPQVRKDRYFFSRRLAGQDQAVIYMRQGLKGKDQALIDPNPLSADRTTSANLLAVSDDGTLLAYGLRQGGEDEVAIRLFDVERRRDLADQLPRGRYMGLSITPDKSGFYYSRHGAQGSRVYFHALGKDPGADPEIFGKGYTPDKGVSGRLTEDGRYLIFQVTHGSAADKVEIYFQDLVKKGPITPVVNDITARFSGHTAGNTLYMLTNWQAPNGRILAVDLTNPARERWREIIPAGQAVLEGFSAAGGKLFVTSMENVQSTLKIFSAEGKHLRDVPMPAIGRIGGVSGRWSRQEAFFQFDSFHIPGTIYRYDIAGDRQEVWARLNVRIDAGQFETRQVWYPSKDGTKIPMFLFHRKGLKLDGARPVFLTGYGGFNLNRTAEFSPTAVLWAEQGGVFALPNLRGGGEFGEAWHRAGMLANKQNVFDDFIAAAQWLIKAGYTSPAKLAISGRSNGGLLVGAALTQRPELFRAVVCGYPLLDMIRYQKFLIARFWVPEYGSSDNPDQFKFIHAYSPYHHVKAGTKYPAVLFVTGDSDTRVAPLHARKMAALLQAATGLDRPVLLHYDTKAGHTRGMPMGKQIDDLTDELSFLLWQLESPHD